MISSKSRTIVATMAALATTACASTSGVNSKGWESNEQSVPIRLTEVGSWQMTATRLNRAGEPECYETWIFKKDGTGSLISGGQTITLSWHYAEETHLVPLLYKTFETSVGGPDCLGRNVDHEKYPTTNGLGYQLLFYGNGAEAYVCFPPREVKGTHGKTITMQQEGNCWGKIRPLEG